ncbi:Serine/threonine-protein kinase ATR [Hibiscus syriacus]|uniref:non-specific serine/threonine protein kinase n=1 Tax=Hibiscus syriacus TaxID=106335 RepID=A0A6A3C1X9_HIBSY|nr:Serine/threonine-protein kinase ATR [Hibiscus syriacus]
MPSSRNGSSQIFGIWFTESCGTTWPITPEYLCTKLAMVPPSSTKNVISQVFSALIPLLEKDTDNSFANLHKVVEILEGLVLKNRVILKERIHEFPLLPSIPALMEVNKAIQEARGAMTLKIQLRDVVAGLNHENLNVRYMVVSELSKLLKLRKEDVAALESRIVVGQRLKLMCADCLGAFGAVDPAKLRNVSCQRFKIQCSNDDLTFELIHKHLARAFRAAPDTVVQDSAALAIQEVLKIAGCEASLDENVASISQAKKDKEPSKTSSLGIKASDSSSGNNSRGQKLWDRFSNYVKEIIAPCLPSRFQLPNVADSASAAPIYRPPMSFRRWIFSWIKKLTVHAIGSRASIFNACRGLVRHDMQTAMYLLPYLVLNAVCHGTEEARHGITEEIQSVLNAAAQRTAVYGVTSGQSEVCIQAVFTLLDNLGQWVDDVKQELALFQSLSSASNQQASKSNDQCLALSAKVLTVCEQALQMEPTSVQRHSDVLNCLLNMCHLQAMVTHVDGLISRIPKYKKTWCMKGVQAAWRLGRWDLMDEYLSGADEEGLLCSSSESNASFDLDVAKILQSMMKKDQFSVAEKIALSKQSLIASLAAAGMDSYTRAYPNILCRLAGHYETANQAILEAQASGVPNVHMEKAKLLWSTRCSNGAIAELQQPLLNMPVEIVGSAAISSITSLSLVPLNPQPLPYDTQAMNENQEIAKTLLQYSKWIHYTGQKQQEDVTSLHASGAMNENQERAKTLLYSKWIHYTWPKHQKDVISLYSRVRELQPKWEKGYFYIAKYCDEVLVDARKRQEENFELGPRIIPSASPLLLQARTLKNTGGISFLIIYQRSAAASNKDLKKPPREVTSIIRGCLKDLPTYQWLTDLPQLVSRICHQNEDVVKLVKNIIISVVQKNPQQALWIMAAVSKSTVPSRWEAAAEIIQVARKGFSHGTSGNNLFVQFASLIDHLIKLCFHSGQSKSRNINISTEFSALKGMMPLGIVMPIQQSLTVSLPTYDADLTESLSSDIFSGVELPTISGIADEAEILSSLQRPKKIVLLGSDGIERPFLIKPKDDLRKDARMMEFTAMINRLLSKYPESRRRKLYIRTFAVIPLTEDCGMVEWVPRSQEDEMLKNKILPMLSPVFQQWFLTTFSELAAWLAAYAHNSCLVHGWAYCGSW